MENEIKRYGFKEGLPIQFEIIDLQKLFTAHQGSMARLHRTSFYQIFWFQQGRGSHMVDFKPVQIEPGSMLFLNRNVVQRSHAHSGFQGVALLFTAEFYCRAEADSRHIGASILFNDLLDNTPTLTPAAKQPFRSLVELMREELQQPKDERQGGYLQNLLQNFLFAAERSKRRQGFVETKKSAHLNYVTLFREELNKSFCANKTVGYYAQQLHVSEKRLNQATSAVLGQSPKQLINDRVTLEAKRLMAHTTDGVKEVGYSLGFDEPTNFIKYFRQHVGVTPIEFRAQFEAS